MNYFYKVLAFMDSYVIHFKPLFFLFFMNSSPQAFAEAMACKVAPFSPPAIKNVTIVTTAEWFNSNDHSYICGNRWGLGVSSWDAKQRAGRT